MSDEKHETHAETIAEMRHGFNQSWHDIDREWAHGLVDRLEAAHKREVETLNSVIQAECASHCAERERLRRACNAAKLREALKIVAQSAAEIMERVRHKDGLAFNTANYIIGIADAALAVPPRNCDVGTPIEQHERFVNFCSSHQYYIDEFHGYDCKKDCPIGKMIDKNWEFSDKCQSVFGQMPYDLNSDVRGNMQEQSIQQ